MPRGIDNKGPKAPPPPQVPTATPRAGGAEQRGATSRSRTPNNAGFDEQDSMGSQAAPADTVTAADSRSASRAIAAPAAKGAARGAAQQGGVGAVPRYTDDLDTWSGALDPEALARRLEELPPAARQRAEGLVDQLADAAAAVLRRRAGRDDP